MDLLKMIIVDDEPITLQGLVQTYDWERMGFQVTGFAENGERALALIRKIHPHLVLTDIRMKEMTGLEMMEAARQAGEEPVFVVISAYRDFEYAKKACDVGAFSYLVKPIDEEQLQEVMHSVYETCLKKIKSEQERENFKRILMGDQHNYLQVMTQKYLQGSLNDEKMQEVLQILRREIRGTQRFICVCADIDISYKIIDPLYYETERTCLFRYLEQVFQGRFEFQSMDMENGNHVFLLRTDTPGGVEEVKKILKEAAGMLKSPVISAISGEHAGFAGMKKSFWQAVHFFETASEAGANAFTSDRQEEVCEEQMSLPEIEKTVMNAIHRNDKTQLKEAMVQFVYQLPEEKTGDSQKKYIHRLAVMVEFMLQDSYGLTKELEHNFQNLYTNLNQISMMKAIDICYRLFVQVIEERMRCAKRRDIAFFSEYMSKALAYIDEHIHDETLSLTAVAAEVYLNPVYFGRVFKNTQNISFKQYLLELRMELAKKLIVEGKDNISVICEKVGIPNRSYFSQVFKQYTGMLPSEYKKEQEP